MNRRDFIKAALAIPAVAALPNPAIAAEELLEGITYISQSFINGEGIAIVESWRKAAGKVWRCVASEDRIISLTEEQFCPWVTVPWTYPHDIGGEPK